MAKQGEARPIPDESTLTERSPFSRSVIMCGAKTPLAGQAFPQRYTIFRGSGERGKRGALRGVRCERRAALEDVVREVQERRQVDGISAKDRAHYTYTFRNERHSDSRAEAWRFTMQPGPCGNALGSVVLLFGTQSTYGGERETGVFGQQRRKKKERKKNPIGVCGWDEWKQGDRCVRSGAKLGYWLLVQSGPRPPLRGRKTSGSARLRA